jgi:hypothetical protein
VTPSTLSTCVALALFALTPATFAQDLRLNQREVHAITDVVRTMFEGVRDGDVAKITAVIPTRAEFVALYQPGAQPFLERHLRAIERDTRELRTVFAGATFVGLDPSFAVGRALRLERCGRFGARLTMRQRPDHRVSRRLGHSTLSRRSHRPPPQRPMENLRRSTLTTDDVSPRRPHVLRAR